MDLIPAWCRLAVPQPVLRHVVSHLHVIMVQFPHLTGSSKRTQAEAAAQDASEKFTRDLARAATAAAADFSAKVR